MLALTVIIVSWNVRDLLDRCLTSLYNDLKITGVQAEVWVVDNDSVDGSAALVAGKHPWVHLEMPGENLGFVQGNNLVLDRLRERSAMPDAVWLLNPDTEVQAGATRALLQFLATHPKAGLIGPKLLNPDGALQHGAFRFPGLLQPLFDLGMLPSRFYESRYNGRYAPYDYAKSEPFRVDHPLGAAMMARGQAVAEIGTLDPQFFMYCEEIDWAWRMQKAGWEVWLAPEAEIIHFGGASTAQARPAAAAHLWESRARLYKKHHRPWIRAIVGFLVRRHFRRKPAPSPEWEMTYQRIVTAWK
ncbi:MAG: glycosyltransferase family 2 protein [Anaerolineae bacterium]|nr:glycosyltransferase family 2 protein [Anaerolineae bacterium]